MIHSTLRLMGTSMVAAILMLFSLSVSAQSPCTQVSYYLTPGIYPGEVSFTILDSSGVAIAGGDAGASQAVLCLADGCYTVQMNDSFGDGWNNAVLTISTMNGVSFAGSLPSGSVGTFSFGVNAEGCGTPVLGGCTDPNADNFNPLATSNDGSCSYSGCTDPAAINFDATATVSDSSCVYCNGEGSVVSNLYVCAFGNAQAISLQITGSDGSQVATVANLIDYQVYNANICLTPGVCYTATVMNSTGPFGWYGGYFWVNANGAQIINYHPTATAELETVQFSIDGTCGPVAGCTNVLADNYNVDAQIDDGSCFFAGCTDTSAMNYDQTATVDDGSCQYCTGTMSQLYICTFGNGQNVALQILDGDGNQVYYQGDLNSGQIFYASLCLQPGVCYTANMINTSGPFGWYGGYFWVNYNGVQIIHTNPTSTATSEQTVFSVDGTCGPVFVGGCTDSTAVNFNIEATYNDGSCLYPVWGCTDSTAVNYNVSATSDDGSCFHYEDCANNVVNFVVSASYFGNEISYTIADENGNTVLSGANVGSSYACLPDGCYAIHMYDSFGDGWDGNGVMMIYVNGVYVQSSALASGNYGVAYLGVNSAACVQAVYGCTDPTALNYNQAANTDDGSCEYQSNCIENLVQISIYTQGWGSEISWQLVSDSGLVVAEGGNYASWTNYTGVYCIPTGCYNFVMNDSWGDGWEGGYYVISGANAYSYGGLYYGTTDFDIVGINTICGQTAGCTDSTALNYNPAATIDDGSCVYNQNPFYGQGSYVGVDFQVVLYPNPTTGGIVLSGDSFNPDSPIQVWVRSMDGKLVDQFTVQNDQATRQMNLDFSNLTGGFYLMEVKSGDSIKTMPFVKQ